MNVDSGNTTPPLENANTPKSSPKQQHIWKAVWALIAVLGLLWARMGLLPQLPYGPEIAHAGRLFFQMMVPLNKAGPERFSVAVGSFTGDNNDTYRNLIIQVLRDSTARQDALPGLYVYPLNRIIGDLRSSEERQLLAEQQTAQQYIAATMSDVLIWGRVEDVGGSVRLRIRWLVRGLVASNTVTRSHAVNGGTLDDVFWQEAANVLRLAIGVEYTRYQARRGHGIGILLMPLIARVAALLESTVATRWKPADRCMILRTYANALLLYAEQEGSYEAIRRSGSTFHNATEVCPAESIEHALALNGLATVYLRIGEKRHDDTDTLRLAADTYDRALRLCPPQRDSLVWSLIKHNLGNALWQLGRRDTGSVHLRESIVASEEALSFRRRESQPLLWALTTANIANVMITMGERESGTRHLQQAERRLRQSLEIITPDNLLVEWIRVTSNLGVVLTQLDIRDCSMERLEDAAIRWRAVLKVANTKRFRSHYARAQGNYGYTLYRLSQRVMSERSLEQALDAYGRSLAAFDQGEEAWSGTIAANYALALIVSGEQDATNVRLLRSAKILDSLAGSIKRSRDTPQWALLQSQRGAALETRGGRSSADTDLRAAQRAYRDVLGSVAAMTLDWGTAMCSLGDVERQLAERRADVHGLKSSVGMIDAALDAIDESDADDWTWAQACRGRALLALGRVRSDAAVLKAAGDALGRSTTRGCARRDSLLRVSWQGEATATLGIVKKDVIMIDDGLARMRSALSGLPVEGHAVDRGRMLIAIADVLRSKGQILGVGELLDHARKMHDVAHRLLIGRSEFDADRARRGVMLDSLAGGGVL